MGFVWLCRSGPACFRLIAAAGQYFHAFAEGRIRLTTTQPCPLHGQEHLGNERVSLCSVVDAQWNDERSPLRDQVRTLFGQVPFQSEKSFQTRLRVRRNDG